MERGTTRTSPAGTCRAGFTLIEIAAVTIILGLMLAVFLVRADSITPKSRLLAASRLVGGCVRAAVTDAVAADEKRVVEYDLQKDVVKVLKVAAGVDVVLLEKRLDRVDLEDVKAVADGDGGDVASGDTVRLSVAPSGMLLPHVVYLKNSFGEMSVVVNGLTGGVRYLAGRVDVKEMVDVEEE